MTGPLCALVSSSSKRRASILVVRLVCGDPGPGLPAALGTSQVLDKYYLGWESAPPICGPQKCSSWWPAIEDMDLDQLDLNPRIIAAVKKARLKAVREVLHFSGADLQRLTGLSSPDVQHLLTAASSHLRGGPILTALHLYQQRERFPAQHQRLSLGCPILDGLLGGGLPLEGITELAGRSSAGKTQLALQLCLAVQFPPQHGGLEAGAVYICTEDAFPSRRLQQLMQQQQRLRADVPQDVVQSIRFGSQIFVEHAANADTLLECVSTKVPVLLSRGMARLVVVDSVAGPFRCEFDGQASATRARHLQSLGATLRRLSSTFRSPVLCINQKLPRDLRPPQLTPLGFSR
ncbi:DNA repair protein XRCC3 isoform X4 [Marmota marmota marmota]|uniref:DNA repair protein XRCC3 isoform X4 n=1 Tax=Marmota marmota marmota TaxID=9994 RepID=UPI00209234E6|nr:DNA repair protein XRCC3 isoform X4 [Marmota marmota marmota]XP_048655387.1 DNA repair protein XRCC3 isoform X4 [Marmota marmota marmota]